MTELSSTPPDLPVVGDSPATDGPGGFSAFLLSLNALETSTPEQWIGECPSCSEELDVYLVDDPVLGRVAVRTRCLLNGCQPFDQTFLDSLSPDSADEVMTDERLNTDLGRAQILHAGLELGGIHIHWSGAHGFFIWENERWTNDRTGERMAAFAHGIGHSLRDAANRRTEAAQSMAKSDRRTTAERQAAALLKAASKAESSAAMSNAVSELKRLPGVAVADDAFDGNPDLLGVGNGVVDLRTGVLQTNTPELFVSRHIETDFVPDATAPRWLEHLRQVLPSEEEGDFLRRWFGYSATGHNTEGKMPIFLGEGRNGKGVITETIQSVFSTVAYETSFGTFCEQARGNNEKNAVAQFAHCRLVFASEASSRHTMDAAQIKALTGGNRIAAKFMYHDEFSFSPKFSITLSTNEMPRVADTSLGFWDRVLVLRFPHSFTGSNADTGLKAALLDESEGVLAWAVQGAVEWAASETGLGTTASIKEETESFRQSADDLGEFFLTFTEVEAGEKVSAKDLFAAYIDWTAEENVKQPIQRKTLLARAAKLSGVRVAQDRNKKRYVSGMRLNPAAVAEMNQKKLDPTNSARRTA